MNKTGELLVPMELEIRLGRQGKTSISICEKCYQGTKEMRDRKYGWFGDINQAGWLGKAFEKDTFKVTFEGQ